MEKKKKKNKVKHFKKIKTPKHRSWTQTLERPTATAWQQTHRRLTSANMQYTHEHVQKHEVKQGKTTTACGERSCDDTNNQFEVLGLLLLSDYF